MRKPYFFVSLLILLFCQFSGWSDSTVDSFCHHRYESFRACPVDTNSIVFIGNSITNMGNWSEFFNNDPRIKNRGNSATDSNEWLDDIETVISSKPASIFIMIGTNDIGRGSGTPQSIARNFRRWAERTKAESPKTKLYCVSTFPSVAGKRNLENHAYINQCLKEVCEDTGNTFIDLWDNMQGIIDCSISKDRLHITAEGYRIWIDGLLPYLPSDLKVTLSDKLSNETLDPFMAGQPTTYGKRISLFSALPVNQGDILLIGDEYLNGGEWAELLKNTKVKNRASAWGNDAGQLRSFENWRNAIPSIFDSTNAPKDCPEQILVGIGRRSALNGQSPEEYKADMLSTLKLINKYAPKAKISLLANLPVHDNIIESLILRYNDALRMLSDSLSIEYIDIHSPMCDMNANADSSKIDNTKDYVTAKGYVCLANILAKEIPGCCPMSEEEFLSSYSYLLSRINLGRLIERLVALEETTPIQRLMVKICLANLKNNASQESLDHLSGKISESFNSVPKDVVKTENIIDERTIIRRTQRVRKIKY